MQERISFVPRNVVIKTKTGIDRYELRAMSVDRSMSDSISAHVGGEFDAIPRRLTLRAGYLYETPGQPIISACIVEVDAVRRGPQCSPSQE